MPGLAQDVDECRKIALDPQLEHAARRALQLLDRPLRRHLPLIHHDHVVARVFDIGQEVRRQDQVDVLVVAEIANQLEHLVAPLGIHAVGGLVEEQEIGIVHERLRELDALLHAGRVGLDVAVARLAEADVVEHFVRALHRVNGGQAGKLSAVGDERHRVHAGNVSVAFRHVADAGADFERPMRHVKAEHRHAPLGRLDEAEQRLQQRALPRAVGAQQAHGPRIEPGGHFLQRAIGAVDDRDTVEVHHGLAG